MRIYGPCGIKGGRKGGVQVVGQRCGRAKERVPKARYIDIAPMHRFSCALECEVGILDHTNFYPDLLPWFVIHLTE